MATQLAPQPEAETVIPPVEADNDTAQTRSAEDEARARGWRPEAEYTGRAPWVDAETFVARGEENLGLAQETIKQLKKRNSVLEGMVKKVTKLEQTAYENAMADIKAKQREAVALGDEAAFDKLDQQADKLREENAPEKPAKAHGEDPAAEFENFRDANPWWDAGELGSATPEEKAARIKAKRLFDKYVNEGLPETMAPSELMAKVASEVTEAFPALGKPAARAKPTSDVAGVTRTGAPRNARTGANLPPEAKAQAERFLAKGVYSGTKAEAYDKFAKSFDWDGYAKENAR